MYWINWFTLTTTLNNLDADNEYKLSETRTIRSKRKDAQHHDWHIVSDPIATLEGLKNLAKQAVQDANKIIVSAVEHGYKE
jgi:hypothetical protein